MGEGSKKRRFELLARPMLDALFRTARRLVGNATLAEDLVQEACLRAFAQFDPADEPAQFRPWLFRILVNLSVDALRRHARERGLPVEGDPRGSLDVIDPSPLSRPDRLVESRETGRALEQALSELAPELRAVVILVLIEEMTYAEAAESLSLSESLVRSRLSRGRMQLRQRIAELAESLLASKQGMTIAIDTELKRGSL